MIMDTTPAFLHDCLKFGINLGLERMKRLCELLDNPQDKVKCIHVAGTNGKGSVVTYISSILAASGMKVGVYTSPFLERFSERMRVICGDDGLRQLKNDDSCGEIDEESLKKYTAMAEAACKEMVKEGLEHPTEFEVVTAIAFLWFSTIDCDVVVLETGLGGRLDSTNIITNPLCTVITAMALDHTDRLGDTIDKIAFEKAGIFKKGCCAIVAEPSEMLLDTKSAQEITKVFNDRAIEVGTTVEYVSARPYEFSYDSSGVMHFKMADGNCYDTTLLGDHQIRNAALAIACVRKSFGDISESDIKLGVSLATWKGRAELVSTNPIVILDGGHNPQGVMCLTATLAELFEGRMMKEDIRILSGVMSDKDYGAMLECFRRSKIKFGDVIGTTVANPRSLAGDTLCKQFKLVYNDLVKTTAFDDAVEATREAVKRSFEDGMPLLITGSLYLIGEVRAAAKEAINDCLGR